MKNKLFHIAGTCLIVFLIFISSCKKQTSSNSNVRIQYHPKYELAKTGNELAKLSGNSAVNIIRSKSDFDDFFKLYETPLLKLSQEELNDFRNNITDRKREGIVGFKFGDLKKKLSYDEFAEVMAMFGIDVKDGYWGFSKNPKIIEKLNSSKKIRGTTTQAFSDHENYKCESPHNCYATPDYICLSNC